jgi:glycosyltransferase involved in cell wall biosynthesis
MPQSERQTRPRVAIVTPVYNGGKYLRQTMESVQRQTYDNLVHVVCNNCSTDDSADIIKEFSGGKVPVLAFENESVLPLAANWNRAFSHLPEDVAYAKLLCADDLIRADGIERFVEAAESDPSVEVVLSQDVFDDRVHRASLPQDKVLHDGLEFARKILLGRVGWVAFHHFFVRVHEDYRNGRFIDNYWSPDPHVVMRSALRGKLAYLQEPLVYNRIHADSVTGKELGKKGVQFELVQMHLLDHFGSAALGEGGLRRQAVGTFLTNCCRLAIRWRLTQQGARSAELLGALQSNGYRPRFANYVRAVAGWPLHSLSWRYRQEQLGAAIDEAAFSTFGTA